MAKYAVVRLDNMQGTTVGTKLRSAKFFKDEVKSPVENGVLVELGGLLEGERELVKAVAAKAETKKGKLALVASPEVIYETSLQYNLENFRNEADEAIRCYILCANDIFSVSVEGFEAKPTVGQGIVAGADGKMKAGALSDASIGEVKAVDVVDGMELFVIEVL